MRPVSLGCGVWNSEMCGDGGCSWELGKGCGGTELNRRLRAGRCCRQKRDVTRHGIHCARQPTRAGLAVLAYQIRQCEDVAYGFRQLMA